MRQPIAAIALAVLTILLSTQAPASNKNNGPSNANVLSPYTDPKQQTAMPFGTRSHWLQPWRAYIDTWPTSRMRDAIGIVYNVNGASPPEAVCRHLARHGYRHVRIEIGWNAIDAEHPDRLVNQDSVERLLRACRANGLRPLLLLNSNHGIPCPTRMWTARLTEPARKGDRLVHLAPESIKQIVVGRSGLSNLSGYWAAECLFTRARPDGTITLSQPLPKDIPAGDAPAATLSYLPFYPSRLASTHVSPPEFDETMRGWLAYVGTIGATAKRALQTEGKPDAGFDFEVWNELNFGSNFLDINRYYQPPISSGEAAQQEILRRTVVFVRDPANRLPGVGIGNGFANQRPWDNGSDAPPGLTAIDKHPYAGMVTFRATDLAPSTSHALNARAEDDSIPVRSASLRTYNDEARPPFSPSYVAHLPEYFLTAIQTEHIVRDLSPLTTEVFGKKHGRMARPLNREGQTATTTSGKPANAPTVWITEVNFDAAAVGSAHLGPDAPPTVKPIAPTLTRADAEHLKAKALLRYLSAYVNKGVSRIYFFAAQDDNSLGLGMVAPTFFTALKNAKSEDAALAAANDATLDSPEMTVTQRFAHAFSDGISATEVRPLTLASVEEPRPRIQFAGDPATVNQTPNPRPPLYNRDVLAFLPFQATRTRYVVPVYVMTRNIAQLYKPDAPASDSTRFDMPPETFRLTIGGLSPEFNFNREPGATASLYDPLENRTYPVKVVRGGNGRVTLELALTDSPRLLIIQKSQARK